MANDGPDSTLMISSTNVCKNTLFALKLVGQQFVKLGELWNPYLLCTSEMYPLHQCSSTFSKNHFLAISSKLAGFIKFHVWVE